MTNFEVVYIFGPNDSMKLPSKVYAVMQNNFLIVDGWGKFHWVPMNKCTERSAWEFENGSLDICASTVEEDEEPSESAWDSYDRWVEESWRDQ